MPATSEFQTTLRQFDNQLQSVTFQVRSDSFAVFRSARREATAAGFATGWELLGNDEPLKFGSGGQVIPTY